MVLDKSYLCDCGDKINCLDNEDGTHYFDWSKSGPSKPFNTPKSPLLERKNIFDALGLPYNPNGRLVSQKRLEYFIIDEFGRCFVSSSR